MPRYASADTFFFFFLIQELVQPIRKQGSKLGVPSHNREAWPYRGFSKVVRTLQTTYVSILR